MTSNIINNDDMSSLILTPPGPSPRLVPCQRGNDHGELNTRPAEDGFLTGSTALARLRTGADQGGYRVRTILNAHPSEMPTAFGMIA